MVQNQTSTTYRSAQIPSLDIRYRVDAVNQLLNPEFVILQLGFTISKSSPKELRCACKIHGGDNTSSFRVNLKTKTWSCYSHKCHSQYGTDFIALYRSVYNCGFMEALTSLEDMVGVNTINSSQLVLFRQNKEKEKFIASCSSHSCSIPSYVDENKLNLYKPFRSKLFSSERFSNEVLDEFSIAGGFVDEQGIIRDIIPIYNSDDKLVAYSLRDIRPEVNDSKYKLTPGFDKDNVLYNLNRCKDILQTKPVIIVEGFKSVWRLHSLGIKNVVACMGSCLTSGQAALLYRYAKEVVLFFDNDIAGAIGIGQSYDLLKHKIKINVEWITEVNPITGKGLDPADLSEDRILYYLGNYI